MTRTMAMMGAPAAAIAALLTVTTLHARGVRHPRRACVACLRRQPAEVPPADAAVPTAPETGVEVHADGQP